MKPECFDDDDWVEQVYLPELHRSVCAALGAKDMTIFDWMLRKRASSFPVRKPGEDNGENHQPSLSAHIGERQSYRRPSHLVPRWFLIMDRLHNGGTRFPAAAVLRRG
jgi:hypothetical protein